MEVGVEPFRGSGNNAAVAPQEAGDAAGKAGGGDADDADISVNRIRGPPEYAAAASRRPRDADCEAVTGRGEGGLTRRVEGHEKFVGDGRHVGRCDGGAWDAQDLEKKVRPLEACRGRFRGLDINKKMKAGQAKGWEGRWRRCRV